MAQPFLSGHPVYAAPPRFAQLRNRRVFCRPLILETELLLHSLRFFIPLVIAAPDPRKVQVFKGMAQQLPRRLRHEAPSPVGNAQPVAKLGFVVLFRKVIAVQTDAPDGQSCLFQHDCVCLRHRQDVPYDLTAVFNARVYGPSGNGTYARVFGISVAFFRIRFFPRTENQSFCLQHPFLLRSAAESHGVFRLFRPGSIRCTEYYKAIIDIRQYYRLRGNPQPAR